MYSFPTAEETIVLFKRGRGESDLTICMLGRELGVFYATAKHGRKSKRRFLNILEPPSLITAYIRRVRGFGSSGFRKIILEKAEIIHTFPNIKSSLEGIYASWYMLELTRAVSLSPDVFPVLRKWLVYLESLLSESPNTCGEDKVRNSFSFTSSPSLSQLIVSVIAHFSAEVLRSEGLVDDTVMSQIKRGDLNYVKKVVEEIHGGGGNRKLKFFKLIEKIESGFSSF